MTVWVSTAAPAQARIAYRRMRERWRILVADSRDSRGVRVMAASDIRPPVTEEPNAPDLYVDQFWFATSQIGATLTLIASYPPEPGSDMPDTKRIVGRIRMPLAVAANLGEVITKQRAIRAPQPPKGTKH